MNKPILKVLSLGAGVQSSTLALLAEAGGITKPDCAIFADTGHEPRHTRTFDPGSGKWITGGIYGWLDWLESQVSFPIYRVHKGNLFEVAAEVRLSQKSGKLYMKGLIPAFIDKGDGKPGLLGRKCTADYKIIPIQQKVRELLGVKRGGKSVACEMWVGISMDEVIRMKPSRVPYIRNTWPLIDLGMTRQDCLRWLSSNGYPIAPRSACVGCPFHGDDEWRNLQENSPLDFAAAVADEQRLQDAARRQEALDGMPYLHGSCQPLDTITFSDRASYGQLEMFGNECEGMCGV
ncbi:hypothetical protein [Geminisphaera colitermitum]|uniref:hypothetical protein n=1 Tax=Geminisphaera colitermitum TaxID=1148786 RepID=UPI0006950CD3|nr:hypothetical protein [Geminisphaera colitermitum]